MARAFVNEHGGLYLTSDPSEALTHSSRNRNRNFQAYSTRLDSSAIAEASKNEHCRLHDFVLRPNLPMSAPKIQILPLRRALPDSDGSSSRSSSDSPPEAAAAKEKKTRTSKPKVRSGCVTCKVSLLEDRDRGLAKAPADQEGQV